MKIKIKVPSKVYYGCHTFKVFLKDESLPDDEAQVYHLLQEIRVRDNVPLSRRNVAFIHENIHCINLHYSCDLSEETIEKLAEGLGRLLFSTLGIELDWSGIPTKTATIKEEK